MSSLHRERARPGRIVVSNSTQEDESVVSILDSSVAENSPARTRRSSEASGNKFRKEQTESRRKSQNVHSHSLVVTHGIERDSSPRRYSSPQAFSHSNNPSPTKQKSGNNSPTSKKSQFTPKEPAKWNIATCGWEIYLVWDRMFSQVGGTFNPDNPYADFYRYSIFFQFAGLAFIVASLVLTSQSSLTADLPRFLVKMICVLPLLYLWVSEFVHRFVHPAYLYDEDCDRLFKEAQGKANLHYLHTQHQSIRATGRKRSSARSGLTLEPKPVRTKAQDRIRRLVRFTTLVYWPIVFVSLLQGYFSWLDVSLGIYLLLNIFAVQVQIHTSTVRNCLSDVHVL
jgi:hypothetical protein